jgi:hypothetical protein
MNLAPTEIWKFAPVISAFRRLCSLPLATVFRQKAVLSGVNPFGIFGSVIASESGARRFSSRRKMSSASPSACRPTEGAAGRRRHPKPPVSGGSGFLEASDWPLCVDDCARDTGGSRARPLRTLKVWHTGVAQVRDFVPRLRKIQLLRRDFRSMLTLASTSGVG